MIRFPLARFTLIASMFAGMTLTFLAAPAAEAQIAAAVVAPGNNGVLQLDENGRGVFAVVALNLGKPAGTIPGTTPPQQCGFFGIEPTGMQVASVCVLNEAGGCRGEIPAFGLVTQLAHGEVGVFGILIQGPVPSGRVTVLFTEFSLPVAPGEPGCEFGPPTTVVERGAVSISVKP